ncbi:hypothetical protein Tco_1395066 [Tanacetum coccineum]
MDANKKVDLENPLCPDESRILENILQNHPLRFSIADSSSVPWIYLGRFWHTLQEDGSKNKLTFMLDRKELTLTLDDFRTIFHLPQSTDNNHDHFVPAPKFSEMVPFYINNLSFTLELRSTSNFKTTGLLQPWQILCKMFSRCLTTRVIGYDQPSLQIMQMLYYFVNNIHVDYAELLWEGKSKGVVGIKIPDWMIIDEMKLMENYRLYDEVFGVDVHTTQSQPIESTQGTHRTTSSPKTPNPEPTKGKSSAPRRSTIIRLRIPPRQSARLTPPTPIPTTDEADDLVLQDTLQVSLAEQKSHEEIESKQNEEKVKEHLMAEEIKKLVDGPENVEENVEVSSSPFRNDDNQTNPDTRLDAKSDKERPKVEKIANISQPVNVIEEEEESAKDDYELKRREKRKHVEEIRNTPSPTTIISPRTHSNLISSDTEKLQELTKTNTIPSSSTPSSSSPKSKISYTNRLLSLFKSKSGRFKRYKSFFDELQGKYSYLFGHLTTRILPRRKFNELARYLQDIMMGSLPKMVDSSVRSYMSRHVLHVHPTQATPTTAQEQQHQLYLTMKDNPQLQQDDLSIWLALMYKFKRFHMATTPCRPSTVRPRD